MVGQMVEEKPEEKGKAISQESQITASLRLQTD
jgi:hypothetical protein